MPTYRYRCQECGEEFETWQSITAEPLRTHDHGCGGGLVKVLTPAGIVLKGSGFYKTDSRSGSERGAGKGGERRDQGEAKSDGDGADKKDTAKSDTAKTDPKPATTSGSDGKSSSSPAAS